MIGNSSRAPRNVWTRTRSWLDNSKRYLRISDVPVSARVNSILAISPEEEDYRGLRELFAPSHWNLQQSHTRQEALSLLKTSVVPVVVSEQDLPDGNWKNVQADLQQLPGPPLLVVASRVADERLWLEVLESGGFDVLVKPWGREEVRRVIASALQQFGSRCSCYTG